MRSLRCRLPAACAVLLLVAATPVAPRSLSRARPEERDHLGAIPYEPGVGFGLGFSVVKDPGLRGKPGSRDEFGWGGAYHSVYWVDPREQLVVVYFTQLIPGSTTTTGSARSSTRRSWTAASASPDGAALSGRWWGRPGPRAR